LLKSKLMPVSGRCWKGESALASPGGLVWQGQVPDPFVLLATLGKNESLKRIQKAIEIL